MNNRTTRARKESGVTVEVVTTVISLISLATNIYLLFYIRKMDKE